MGWKTSSILKWTRRRSLASSKSTLTQAKTQQNWFGVLDFILSHRLSRLVVPPGVLLVLLAILSTPLLQDLRQLSEDNLTRIQGTHTGRSNDGNLIVNIKNVNPNNGIVTLDFTYVSDDIHPNDKIELWIVSGGVTYKDNKLNYEVDAELHTVPVVMESPTIFEWGNTKRATYKQQNAEIKIDRRSRGYMYPFDRYNVELSFSVINRSQKVLHPSLWCEIDDPRFIHNRPRPLRSRGDKFVSVPNSLTFTLDRPTYQKIFLAISMITGLGCVVWSLYKISYGTGGASESLPLLAFDLTVLLAVPSLRGVFVPSNLQFAPLFDFFVVLIWTIGLLALCVNIVRHEIVVRLRRTAVTADLRSIVHGTTDQTVDSPTHTSSLSPRHNAEANLEMLGSIDQKVVHHLPQHPGNGPISNRHEPRKVA